MHGYWKTNWTLKLSSSARAASNFLALLAREAFELPRRFPDEELLHLVSGEGLAGELLPDRELAALPPATAAEGLGRLTDDAFLAQRAGRDAGRSRLRHRRRVGDLREKRLEVGDDVRLEARAGELAAPRCL